MAGKIIAKTLFLLYFIDQTMNLWTSVDKPYSFNCDYAKNVLDSITWQSQDLISKYKCSIYTMPQCDPADDNASLYYEAKMTSNGSVYTSVFKIKSVPLLPYNTTWFCRVDLLDQTSSKIQYGLNVFAPPKTPTCDTVTVVDDINIQIHCFTEIVFPTAICDFYVNTNATREVYLTNGSIFYDHHQSIINGYNRTDCTYAVSAGILKFGSHLLSVVMYPNIGADITDEMKRSGQYTQSITIGYPQAHLEADCFVHLQVNANRTCTCTDISKHILQSRITWSAGSKTLETNATFIRNITLLEGQSFTCTITNTLNLTDEINYILKRKYDLLETDTEVNFIALGAGVAAALLLVGTVIIVCFVFQKKGSCLFKTYSR
ncbi:unnamed protein product [Lymnaea stagnalis]|uniref:Ig-like domain-containing protein n=1 Tax=Lymnaea stagnalis TaxID=6523 RepID=A0AAV2HD37_LYMST